MDFAVPNARPGTCAKCSGSGTYAWGAIVNGRPTKSGTCWSCKGKGQQTAADIRRNATYNRTKVIAL